MLLGNGTLDNIGITRFFGPGAFRAVGINLYANGVLWGARLFSAVNKIPEDGGDNPYVLEMEGSVFGGGGGGSSAGGGGPGSSLPFSAATPSRSTIYFRIRSRRS